jgi:hypothetical protein
MKASSAIVATIALLAACSFVAPSAAQNLTDADILNFALNLEYLEAEFYSYAVNGRGIPDDLRGGGPASVGGQKANLTDNVLAFATEVAQDELNHVKFLRTALGDAAVPIPRLNIGPAFQAAANAAFNTTLRPRFSPYANNIFFLHGAFIFEDVGVTAYKGAAALITNKDYLTAAAGILAVEAYHAGIVREQLYSIANTTTPYGVNVSTIVQNIAALRSAASGLPASTPNDFGIIVNGTARLVPTDSNGIVYSRTPAQVISIVTLGSTNGTGGFFPRGLNGAINMTLSASMPVAVGDSTPSGMTPVSASSPSGSPAGSPAGSPDAAASPAGSSGSAPAPAPQAAAPAAAAGVSAPLLFAAAAVGAASLLLA